MNSVQEIAEQFVNKLLSTRLEAGLTTVVAHMEQAVKDYLPSLFSAIVEVAEQGIFNSEHRRKNYEVVRSDVRVVETTIGTIRFKRRYYRHKKTAEYVYLLDRMLQLEPRERIDKGLAAALCTEATDCSYRKAAKKVSDGRVSGQAVLTLMKRVCENPVPVQEVRNHVQVIHIQCDEDHVALQQPHRRSIVKLAVIHEPVRHRGKRAYLPHRFALTSTPLESNEDFWLRIAQAIDERYGLRDDLQVYIHGDGAAWIKSGLDWIAGSRFVLDLFHLNSYVRKVSSHYDSMFRGLWYALRNDDLSLLRELTLAAVDMELCHEETATALFRYVKANRQGIRIQLKDGVVTIGSCAEGLVSHLLSDRLSSRPKAWREPGLESMSRLRVHCANGGPLTARDFASKTPPKPLQKHMAKEISDYVFDLMPAPTEVFRHAKRGTWIHRYFDSIKDAGMKFA